MINCTELKSKVENTILCSYIGIKRQVKLFDKSFSYGEKAVQNTILWKQCLLSVFYRDETTLDIQQVTLMFV